MDDDHLLANLHWIFRELGWSTATGPAAFREDFRCRGFYFVHAVKCFSRAQFPSGSNGTQLLRGCATAHLRTEIVELRPERICALGRLPHRALKLCFGKVATRARYLEGASADLDIEGAQTPVLITCFPNGQQGPGVQRQLVLDHLRGWSALRGLKP